MQNSCIIESRQSFRREPGKYTQGAHYMGVIMHLSRRLVSLSIPEDNCDCRTDLPFKLYMEEQGKWYVTCTLSLASNLLINVVFTIMFCSPRIRWKMKVERKFLVGQCELDTVLHLSSYDEKADQPVGH
jgi:hypothetical protein